MAWEQSAQQVKASRRTLDVPLFVLTASPWPAEGRQIHEDLQIVGEAPQLVVHAIRVVADAVRAGSRKLAC